VDYPSGWTCELVILRLEHYLLGTLSHDGALAMAEHLEACACCAQCLGLLQPGPSSRGHGGRRD
jgi:hypothetical protein